MAHRLESNITNLVDTIMKDYEQERDIDVVKDFMHPDKDDIVKIIYQIRNIIFPGYY